MINPSDNNVLVIDVNLRSVIYSIPNSGPLANEIGFITIAPNGKMAYVADIDNQTVIPIDIENGNAVGEPIPIPVEGSEILSGISITPDNTQAYVGTSFNTSHPSSFSHVYAVDLITKETTSIPVGVFSPMIVITPEPNPLKASGKRVVIRAMLQSTQANLISWVPVVGAVSYRVYADSALTKLLFTTNDLEYVDPKLINTYYVVWVDIDGNLSLPTDVNIGDSS